VIDRDARDSVSPGADCKPSRDPRRSISRNVVMINGRKRGTESCILSPLLLVSLRPSKRMALHTIKSSCPAMYVPRRTNGCHIESCK
jgi:hypothetical protein